MGMTTRRHDSTQRLAALLLALCVCVYQTAHSAHDFLHWHPDSHTDGLPSFAAPLPDHEADDHDDLWAEQLLCTVCAAGLVAKSAPAAPAFAWQRVSSTSFLYAAEHHRVSGVPARRLPPARAPPTVSRIAM